jgi:hypothetical protein
MGLADHYQGRPQLGDRDLDANECQVEMPLMMQPPPASTDIWGVSFHMVSTTGTTIHCRITRRALEALAGGSRDLDGFEQAILFDHWRGEIELLASRKYDAGNYDKGLLLIEPEDLTNCLR